MKKVVLFSLCAAAVLASCNNAGQNKDALKLQNDSLMIELSNRDADIKQKLKERKEREQAIAEAKAAKEAEALAKAETQAEDLTEEEQKACQA